MVFNNGAPAPRYYVEGEGTPVVLIHGLGCDHRAMKGCMEPVFQARSGFQRIYVDLPGMGASPTPLEWASADGILELLVELLDRVVDGKFLLAGESYGGYLARGVLAKLHHRIGGMALLCPVVIPEPANRCLPAKDAVRYDEEFLSTLSPEARESFCAYIAVANAYTYRRYKEEVAVGHAAADQAFVARLKEHYRFGFDVDGVIRDAKITAPVLFLAGRQDNCAGYQDLWRLVEDYPRATFSVADLSGHNVQVEREALFTALMDDWLERAAFELSK